MNSMPVIGSCTPRNCSQKTLNEVESGLIQCAHLILPWLTPSELAHTSLTCKALFRFSKAVVESRSLDASRSFENLPIQFHNTLDEIPYAYFLYIPSQIISSSTSNFPQRQFWGSASHSEHKPGSLSQHLPFSVVGESADCSAGLCGLGPRCEEPGGNRFYAVGELGENCGCECEKCLEVGDESGVFECPCFFRVEDVGIASECGPSCRCGLECENRVSQRGIRVRLKIVRVLKKGWGLFADQFIPQGQFICEYAGELLTTKEARRRQKIYDEHASRYGISSALLVVKEHLPSGKACLRMNIDATRVGNVARFINHSCDGGNLSTVLVRSSGALLPRLCFFASKDIQEGEELTFSYGEIRLRSDSLPCFCGSSCCVGILPSENT